MCGIITYKGPKNGTEVVLKGLKSSEYRGYDSWGIASLNGKNHHILTIIPLQILAYSLALA